ncbi:potassium transporter [Diplocarpon rosae]|nr:potassium transporter [Diplocarpon rosae]
MATVRIADAIHPIGLNDGRSSALAGGVYPIRDDTKPPSLDLRSPRSRSIERRGVRIIDHQPVVNDEGLRRDGDFKKKQIFTGKYLLWLAYQSTGVIYGDIGTSPLYVYSSTFSSEPSYQDLVGVLSVIIWSLTLMVTVKYVLIILYADNEGEGGTFSTYSLLSRFANITKRDPREASLIKMERYVTGDIEGANLRIRSRIENSKFARGLLKTIGVLAVSMVMADGVLTPAQSVLGAVQGLNVVKPDIEKSTIVGTTCGILVLLFLIQPFGTTKLASTFAPIVIVWLGFNAGFGIYNLVKFDHTVLKAFSPSFAFKLLTRNKTEGWRQLGGILLAFTGVEALFADLGAFSRKAIQISWLGYAMPCLLLGYIGQAAYISRNEGAYSNPFYNAVPPGMLYPSLVVAILAAIVASQAIITATFQLLSQVMKLSYFPQIKVVHTSKVFHGQVYVPFINWLLMLGTVLAAAIYNNGVEGVIKLTQLYGGDDLSTIKGFGIFFDKAGETTPLVFSQFLSKLVAAPEVMVFFHLRPLETPSVLPENRYTVTRVTIPNCYRLIVRHGYMDEVITPDLASLVYAQIRNFIVCQGAALKATGTCEPFTIQEYAFAPLPGNHEKSFEDPELRTLRTEESIAADLAKLQHAFDRQVLYIIGKEQMRVRNGTGMVRTLLLNLFLWLRDNTRTKIANLRVQPDRVIEVGFVKDV